MKKLRHCHPMYSYKKCQNPRDSLLRLKAVNQHARQRLAPSCSCWWREILSFVAECSTV